jgi:glycosyltransferase involved in cell wall biosynthesis
MDSNHFPRFSEVRTSKILLQFNEVPKLDGFSCSEVGPTLSKDRPICLSRFVSSTERKSEGVTNPPPALAVGLVAVLMCTKDGAAFIEQQLKSIADQTHENWILIVSDDGSSDQTVAKVKQFAQAHPQRTTIRKGPGKGVCANFLSLANDPTIEADYFAFSDQDDIWHQDKLQRALAWLTSVPVDVPGMYCGRTELMTIDELALGFSPLFIRPPAFQNALVQSLAGGNTMVFNQAAKKILEQAATIDVVLHDWWVYQLVSGAGGMVHYDPRPMLKYRQHSDNLIGSNLGWRARFNRVCMMLKGRFHNWNATNIAALRRLPAHLLHPKNREALALFAKARCASLPKRLYYLRQSGVYRQTLIGNMGLLLATILNRV